MTDNLPTVDSDGGPIEAQAVVLFDNLGNLVSPIGGTPVPENSTTTPLGAGETWTGEWVTTNDPQVGYSFQADQDGTLYLDFSRTGGATFATIKNYEVTGGEVGRFDGLIKGAGLSFRLRYTNGATPQTLFEVLAFAGTDLYPLAVSDRDTPRFVAYSGSDIAADTYAILVDLSDKAQYPHNDSGSIDLYSSFIFVDKPSSAVGAVQIGIITRVDGTSADIAYIQGVSFNSTSDRHLNRDRVLTHPIQLGQSGGLLTKVATLFRANGVTAVNTATPLPTVYGTATPEVGDLVVRFAYTSGGAYTASTSVQYAGNVRTQ